uniref:Uncharacterized protein n=1 Tax=Avena sativa TaxID=4498 RepID=A0ACD5UVJ0_AVESA
MAVLVILFATFLPLAAVAAFSPEFYFYLACGTASTVSFPSDSTGRTFVPDSAYLSPSTAPAAYASSSSPTSGSHLYDAARADNSAFSYSFPPYPASHDASFFVVLRLHFFPFVTASSQPVGGLSSARFNVSVLDDAYDLLSSFSPPNAGVIKEFFIPWGGYGDFTIKFTPDNGSSAFVNALELFQAPAELLWNNSVTPVGAVRRKDLALWQQQSLETVYRLNVGGPRVTKENDTLWRTWLPDGPFLYAGEGQSVVNNNTSPIIHSGNTSAVAPDVVYRTQRAAATNQQDLNFNITWTFPAEPGASYLVRLHFYDYEVVSSVVGVGIVFDVYVAHALASRDLSPNDQVQASQSNEALYIDYGARTPSTGNLTVSIGRSANSNGGGILNGLELMKLPDADLSSHGWRGETMRIMVIALSSVLSIAVLACAVLCFFVVRRRRRGLADQSTNRSSESTAVRMQRMSTSLHIRLAEIKAATDNFHDRNLIGVGGFGNVYKGVLPSNGGTPVAVKRAMRATKQGLPEFQTEIAVLSSIRHRQLVSLIGYCNEQAEMILVYEYMEKGTLRSHLYGSDEPALSWKQRLEICIGAARGLHYLHSGHSENVIHRDVKSTNILLSCGGGGAGVIAKVADFGLSRIGPSFGETHVSTVVKGSFGYLDPEYFKTQQLTDRSDVYSLGVVLLEVLCARPVIDHSLDRDEINIANWALTMHGGGQLDKIVDASIAGEVNENSLRKFVDTAERCLADCGKDRPTMGEVVWNLEFCLQLHETHVNRDAFEDSGAVATHLPSDVVVPRSVSSSSTSMLMEEADETVVSMTDVADTQVFSQLDARDKGR